MVESSRGASCCWRREERERSTQSVKRKGDGKGGKSTGCGTRALKEETGGVVEMQRCEWEEREPGMCKGRCVCVRLELSQGIKVVLPSKAGCGATKAMLSSLAEWLSNEIMTGERFLTGKLQN
jgi:hypothetical protein